MPNPAVSSTPMWDRNHTYSDMPAWNPSSQTPLPVQSPTPPASETPSPSGTSSWHFDNCATHQDPSGLPTEWLVMTHLHGKSIKVHLSESYQLEKSNSCRKPTLIPASTIACTLGTHVSGNPPVIEVKLMISGAASMSIPLWGLHTVHPYGVNERVFIISGPLQGNKAIVEHVRDPGSLWSIVIHRSLYMVASNQ